MIIKVIKEDVFDTEVTFIYNCEIEQLLPKIKRLGISPDEDITDCAGCVMLNKKGRARIVYVKDIHDISTVAHEIFHLVVRICNDKGIPILANLPNGDPGDETAAYLLDFYMRKVLCLQ